MLTLEKETEQGNCDQRIICDGITIHCLRKDYASCPYYIKADIAQRDIEKIKQWRAEVQA